MKLKRSIIIVFIILSMIVVGTYTIYERVNNPIKGTWYYVTNNNTEFKLVIDTFKVKYYCEDDLQIDCNYTYKDDVLTYDDYIYNVGILDDDCIHIYGTDAMGLGISYNYYLVRSNERITDMKDLEGDWKITYLDGMYAQDGYYSINVQCDESGSSYSFNNNERCECLFENGVFEVPEGYNSFLVYKINDDKIVMVDEEAIEVWILER